MNGKHNHIKNSENVQGKNQAKNQASNGQLNLSKHIHFESVDSTNTWSKTYIDQWAAEGVTLITASEQTAGRGRFKRRWESPPHVNIYATFCFWMSEQRKDIGHVPQLLALAIAQILEEEGFEPVLRWPNDLLLNGKKVGGILCESVLRENRGRGIICGIGLNVNMPLEILNKIDRPATSLYVERGQPLDPSSLLESLQKVFVAYLDTFIQKGYADFFPFFLKRSAHKKGQWVRFHDNQKLIEARFDQLHPDGSIQLLLSDGRSKIFHAGEFVE